MRVSWSNGVRCGVWMIGLAGMVLEMPAAAAVPLERLADSWLLNQTERAAIREVLDRRVASEISAKRAATYDMLQTRARAQTPEIAYVRRNGYGLDPNVNAAMWCQRTQRGSAIVVVNPADPAGSEREIFTTRRGFIFDIHPSFDGRKLLMTYKTDVQEPFHIWEIHVDGSGLRQLTDGPYHDVTPLYYPDGRIVFASTRCEQYAMCQNFLAFTLFMCEPDGSDIRRIAFDSLCSVSPGLMHDGTILSSRWEYMDKTLWTWQGIWTIHPNGRMLQLFYGNTLSEPEALYAPRQIPDSNLVIYVMAGHYGVPIADLALVDRRRGVENSAASRKLTHETNVGLLQAAGDQWRRTRTRNYHSNRHGYTDPWPFRRELSLASYGGQDPDRASIVLVDHGGLTYPLHRDSKQAAFSPVALAPRPKGHAIAGHAPQEEGFGVFYVQDIYQGLLEQGVERGQVAGLRVWRQVPKKYNTEGDRIHDHYPLIGWGTYYVKELYGTVPVGDSGAVKFPAPANVELYFSAVDDKGREIQRMGSVTQITPGETIGCVGCHDSRHQAPPVDALMPPYWSRPATELVPPPWADGHQPGQGYAVDYVAQVQPVWDRHCVTCHNPREPQGGIDMSGDKSRLFNMSYESLVVRNANWNQGNNRDLVEYYFLWAGPGGHFPALNTGSMASKLVDMLVNGHHDVALTPAELDTVAIWIDANVPYYGTWEMSRPRTPGGRDPYFTLREGSWSDHDTAPGRGELQRAAWSLAVEEISQKLGVRWTSDMLNLSRPELSRLLLRHLSQEAGGWAEPERALFRDTGDPRYQRLLAALREGAADLERYPRMDMPGARPLPQPRDFGRVFP